MEKKVINVGTILIRKQIQKKGGIEYLCSTQLQICQQTDGKFNKVLKQKNNNSTQSLQTPVSGNRKVQWDRPGLSIRYKVSHILGERALSFDSPKLYHVLGLSNL